MYICSNGRINPFPFSMTTQELAPIVLVVFNRPDHTARVIEALAANEGAGESDLYVYSDGPRGERDFAGVQGVRDVVREIRGFRSVHLVERPHNFGCTGNVLSAITETLELHERCIVVEDDIQTSPLFLTYMNRALEHYKEEQRLYAIGAYTTPFKMPKGYSNSLFVCQRHCAWGWGTWKRAWDRIKDNLFIIDKGMAVPSTRAAFSRACGEDLIRTYMRKAPEVWDMHVTYKAWTLGMYTLYPLVSLVKNIGKDGSGTNYTAVARHSVDDFPFPEELPVIGPMPEPDERVIRAFLKPNRKPLWRRMAISVTKALGVYDWLLKYANFGR